MDDVMGERPEDGAMARKKAASAEEPPQRIIIRTIQLPSGETSWLAPESGHGLKILRQLAAQREALEQKRLRAPWRTVTIKQAWPWRSQKELFSKVVRHLHDKTGKSESTLRYWLRRAGAIEKDPLQDRAKLAKRSETLEALRKNRVLKS